MSPAHKKTQDTRVGNSLICFSSDLLIFGEQKNDLLVKNSELLPSLFCHNRPEQMAHGRSFVKSDSSESLKSLFKKEQNGVISSRA